MSLEHGTTHAPSRGDLRAMRENVQRAQLAGSVDGKPEPEKKTKKKGKTK